MFSLNNLNNLNNLGSTSGGSLWYRKSNLALNSVMPSFIQKYTENKYWNSTSGNTTIPFTAIRTTNASMFSPTGDMIWAPANMLLNSATLSTQSVTVTAGGNYTLSFYGTGSITLSGGGSGTLAGTGVTNRVSVSFTASTTSVTFTVTGSVTNAQLEPTSTNSPQAYNATAGSAYYGARFDTNPNTLVARGILAESTATNLAPNSRNVYYAGDNVAGSVSASPTALKNFGGTRFTADGTSAQHFIASPATAAAPTAATQYTISAYVRAGTASLVQLTASTGFVDAVTYANFDLSAGTAGSNGASASNVRIDNCGGSVYRIALTFTSIAVPAAGYGVVIGLISSTSDTRLPTITSSGTIDVMGMQLELGPAPTSLIPTYGVAATRAYDAFNSAVNIPWFDNTKGTMYAQYEVTSTQQSGDHLFIIGKTDFTSLTNSLSFASGVGVPQNRRFDAIVASATVSASSTADTANTVHKLAAKFTAGTTAVKTFKNGVATGTSATAAIPTGLDRYFLTATAFTNYAGIWIKELRYYPDDSATDPQMVTLTT